MNPTKNKATPAQHVQSQARNQPHQFSGPPSAGFRADNQGPPQHQNQVFRPRHPNHQPYPNPTGQQQQQQQQQLYLQQQQYFLHQQRPQGLPQSPQQQPGQIPPQQQGIRPLLAPPPQQVSLQQAVVSSSSLQQPHHLGPPHEMSVANLQPPQPPTPPSNIPPPQNMFQQQQQQQQQRQSLMRQGVPPQQPQGGQQQGPSQPRQPHLAMSSSPGPQGPMYNTTMFMSGQAQPQFVNGVSGPGILTLAGVPGGQTVMHSGYNQPMGGPRPVMPPYMMAQTQQQGPPQGYMPSYQGLPPHHQYQPPPQPQQPPQAQQQQQQQQQQQMPPTAPSHPKETGIRQPTNTVYYNGPNAPAAMMQQRPPVPTSMAGPPPMVPYQRQKRRGLAIIDPNTGVDISENISPESSTAATSSVETAAINSTPQSDTDSSPANGTIQAGGDSSARSSTSPRGRSNSPPQTTTPASAELSAAEGTSIKDQFVKQVAAVAAATKPVPAAAAASAEAAPAAVTEPSTVPEAVQTSAAASPPPAEPSTKEAQDTPSSQDDDEQRKKNKAAAKNQKREDVVPPQEPAAPIEVTQAATASAATTAVPATAPADPTPTVEEVVNNVSAHEPKQESLQVVAPIKESSQPQAAANANKEASPAKQDTPTPAPAPVASAAPAAEDTPPSVVVEKPESTSPAPASVAAAAPVAKVPEQNGTDSREHEPPAAASAIGGGNDESSDGDDGKKSEKDLGEKNPTKLKYHYKEDQWSPLNPEGKRLYDRNFLLELQYCGNSTSKPEGLQHLPDIVLDQPIRRSDPNKGKISKNDFSPTFIQSCNKVIPRGGAAGGGRKNNSQQRNQPHMQGGASGGNQRKVISIGLQETVKLHSSENAWVPTTKKKVDGKDGEEETETVYKNMTAVLNKITPQKFDTLMAQVMALPINTCERLTGSIDIIFEKAIDEPNFSVSYAMMAKNMSSLRVQRETGEVVLFRNILLNRCQREFERDNNAMEDVKIKEKEIEQAKTKEEKAALTEELRLEMKKEKRRTLGNIRFIGELFKLKQLTEKIMFDCITRLLKGEDEENLECLCNLLRTIGKDIDLPKHKARIDAYFVQLKAITAQKPAVVSSRVRFMILDLIDLRSDKWVPRREEGPKTIDAIHKEAALESQDRQRMVQNMDMRNAQSGGARGGGHHHGGRRQPPPQMVPVGEDGWQTAGKAFSRIDPDKMKLTTQSFDESNLKLGPQGGRKSGGPMWATGSSGGGRREGNGSKNASREADKSDQACAPNRFSALSEQQNEYRSAARGRSNGRNDSRDGGRPRGGNPQAGRNRTVGGRSSMEQDREAAIAAARSIHSGAPNQSRESSRDGRFGGGANRSDSREAQRRPPPAAAAAAARQASADKSPTQTVEEVKRKTGALLDEYLHLKDLSEAVECVKEIEPSLIHVFVNEIINGVLEKTSQGRQMVGQLLHDLVKTGKLNVEQYIQGLTEVIELAEEFEIDIPRIWQCLGELIGPMVQGGSVPLSFLRQVVKPIPKKAARLLAEILLNAAEHLGRVDVGAQWQAAGLKWEEFLTPDQDLDEFIEGKKLEFTLLTEQPSPRNFSPEEIQQELDTLIVDQQVDNAAVMDWCSRNVEEAQLKEPVFVRAIITSVCKSAMQQNDNQLPTIAPDLLKSRMDLVQRYIDHNDERELQALYAVQALVHRQDHPNGMLRQIFDVLYDEEVISEDAFYAWRVSQDPAEQTGKGVAFNSVKQFFEWLQDADEAAGSS